MRLKIKKKLLKRKKIINNLDYNKQYKILVLSDATAMGDEIIRLHFLYNLKNIFPNANIYYYRSGGDNNYKILESISKEYYTESKTRFNFNKLKGEKYDIIFDLQLKVKVTLKIKYRIKKQLFLSASANHFFSDFKINKNIAYHYQYDVNDKKTHRFRIQRFVSLLQIFNKPIMMKPIININEIIKNQVKEYFKDHKKVIGIAIGAGGQDKIYSFDKYIHISDYLIDKGYKIAFILGPNELNKFNLLKEKFPNQLYPLQELFQDNEFKYSIKITIELANYLEFVILNDGGTSHIFALTDIHIYLILKFYHKTYLPNTSNLTTIISDDLGYKNLNDLPISQIISRIKL